MARREFDLSSMIDVVSKHALPQSGSSSLSRPEGGARLDTISGPEVKMIPLDDILNNKANFYTVDKDALKPLADSIAMDGLQQYPVVMPHPEQEGKFLLLSGHRRCAAIRMLVEDKENPREDLRMVPCTVKQYQSEAMAELQLILANSTARTLSNAEISKQAERMEVLLYQLKEEGYEFPGRMRDQVAAACKVSAPKLARLKVIREKLKAPEFLYLFEKDKLPEQTAYALARLPEEFQRRLAGITADISGNTAETILKKYEEGWRWEPDMRCPDGKGCKRGDVFLRHDIGCCYAGDMCGGKTCCLECPQAQRSWSPCERMCSKAQALRKDKRDDEKAAADRQRQKQNQQYQKQTQANAQRLLRAVDAAGLPDDTTFRWSYYQETVGELRKYAAGEFADDSTWYEARLAPENLRNPAEVAKIFGCSVDFLFGLTDEVKPVAVPAQEDSIPAEVVEALREDMPADIHPVWLPGTPEKSGPVAARFAIPGPDGAVVLTELAWYDAMLGRYLFSKDGPTIDAECSGWWPVPEKEDSHDDEQ